MGASTTTDSTDILMITYDRSEYTRMSLTQLLKTCDDQMNVWIWHNGTDADTLSVVAEFSDHPKVANFHHSPENVRLWEPTRWFWENSNADYLSKVDDDCLVPLSWARDIRQAHKDVAEFGVIGSWRFEEEDFDATVAAHKIHQFGNHKILRNVWVEGSGYLMKRACLEQIGSLRPQESFTKWCIRAARAGWINGWLYPFLYQEHMDDPRAPHSGLKTDEQFLKHRPLTAVNMGINSVAEWEELLKEDARQILVAPIDPEYWAPWRVKARRIKQRFLTRIK